MRSRSGRRLGRHAAGDAPPQWLGGCTCATKTDISAKDFGEGSFDKGVTSRASCSAGRCPSRPEREIPLQPDFSQPRQALNTFELPSSDRAGS